MLTKFWSLWLNQLVDNTGRLGKILDTVVDYTGGDEWEVVRKDQVMFPRGAVYIHSSCYTSKELRKKKFALRLAPIPYVRRMPYGIKLSGCFPRGEFVLLCFRVQFELSRQITPICPEM